MTTGKEMIQQARQHWDGRITMGVSAGNMVECKCERALAPELCEWLVRTQDYYFSGLVVEENSNSWDLFYLFSGRGDKGTVQVKISAPVAERTFFSISGRVHAADWHEREAEDLFGLTFKGHPQLGDFILHDDAWQEGIEPMRSGFDFRTAVSERQPQTDWRPRRILRMPGAFIMPVGPVFGGGAESVHFQLETIGEEVIRAFPRLFFKYRAVEKIAVGRTVPEALLLAERVAGTSAFSQALAFCLAVERLGACELPGRSERLRMFLAELERLRSHLTTIAGICHSTGLVVAASQVAILEEKVLRLTGTLTGHRYLFGLAIPGGLSRDFTQSACLQVVTEAESVIQELKKIRRILWRTSSFLDRLEEVGMVSTRQVRDHGMVGPVARASDDGYDLRESLPYCEYETMDFTSAREQEGDGYARLRIFLTEAETAVRLMRRIVDDLPSGPVASPCPLVPGATVAGVETPRGATWQWVRLDEEGRIKRYRLMTPSFANWHGFHVAAENFAFQDFPIILSTFGLSVAENDR